MGGYTATPTAIIDILLDFFLFYIINKYINSILESVNYCVLRSIHSIVVFYCFVHVAVSVHRRQQGRD